MPMRIRVFYWLVSHNKLQTGVELKKRKWRSKTGKKKILPINDWRKKEILTWEKSF